MNYFIASRQNRNPFIRELSSSEKNLRRLKQLTCPVNGGIGFAGHSPVKGESKEKGGEKKEVSFVIGRMSIKLN